MVSRKRGRLGGGDLLRPRSPGLRFAFGCVVLLVTSGLVATGFAVGAGSATVGTVRRSPATATVWGLVGGYSGINLADVYHRGVRAVLVEATWADAEPRPGVFNEAYLQQLLGQVRSFRAMGFKVALNYGLEQAPSWLMALPGAHYVNQFGTEYTAEPVPNLIFDTSLRSYAQAFTDAILRLLGRFVYLVRVGGGYDGELDYPPPASGESPNQYWAYGPAAHAQSPEESWRPCSPTGQARAFLRSYLTALVDFQQWQIRSVRSVYRGDIAVLYPSVGFTAANEQQALSDDLCGRTAIEQTGAIARGWDQAQQVGALSGPGLVVYSTAVDNPAAIGELGRLAADRHLALAGENGGFNGPTAMARAVHEARAWHLTSFFWIRAQQAYCGCNSWATIEDYQHDIAG